MGVEVQRERFRMPASIKPIVVVFFRSKDNSQITPSLVYDQCKISLAASSEIKYITSTMQYEELGFWKLTQMEDDYTANSR